MNFFVVKIKLRLLQIHTVLRFDAFPLALLACCFNRLDFPRFFFFFLPCVSLSITTEVTSCESSIGAASSNCV